MSLLSHLPGPRHQQTAPDVEVPQVSTTAVSLTGAFEPPPYLRRQNFVPRYECFMSVSCVWACSLTDGTPITVQTSKLIFHTLHRKAQDFGTGGAFPEIHVAQYPLEMGRPDSIRSSKQTLAVGMHSDGTVAYDAIVKQGSNRNKTVHAEHGALLPKVDRLSREVRSCKGCGVCVV